MGPLLHICFAKQGGIFVIPLKEQECLKTDSNFEVKVLKRGEL